MLVEWLHGEAAIVVCLVWRRTLRRGEAGILTGYVNMVTMEWRLSTLLLAVDRDLVQCG